MSRIFHCGIHPSTPGRSGTNSPPAVLLLPREPNQPIADRRSASVRPWLVPTLGGNPAWIFGHFGLSIVRLSTRQSMGKSQKRPAADFSPSTIQKTIRKPACHEHVPTIDMLAGGDKQVRLENSKRSFRNRGGKNHAQTQTTNRNFDVNSGRSGERYEAEIQQSTK